MPLVPPTSDDAGVSLHAARKRLRCVRVWAAALALSVASFSAALLIQVGQLETEADQAVLEAVRQSPGLST